jgi:hypothetical protein
MCTLSFMPVQGGFHLLMNRDEQRSRATALPPRLHPCGNLRAIFPSEQGGGTWVGVNERGITAALINWYSRPGLIDRPAFSRGLIIPTLLAAKKSEEALFLLRSLPLSKLDPFRLFLFDAEEQAVTSLSSDGIGLEELKLPWERSHWFSSGYDEPEAIKIRGEISESASKESDADTHAWLSRLHGSHHPEQGPFSICMHRQDACTVSMTEVTLMHGKAELTYHAGSPCRASGGVRLGISLKKSRLNAEF